MRRNGRDGGLSRGTYDFPARAQSVEPRPKERLARTDAPRKIAILGGGVGAMSAAFALTNYPGWQNDFEVTVYQIGWRLGGKGASGRNRGKGDRIEEHGIHVWLGCYDNAFAMIRECYAELGRPPGEPLARWTDAFQPWPTVGVMEEVQSAHGTDWIPWVEDFRVDDQVPGDDHEPISLWDMAAELVELMLHVFSSKPPSPATSPTGECGQPPCLSAAAELLRGPIDAVLGAAHLLEFEGKALWRLGAQASLRRAVQLVDQGAECQWELLYLIDKAVKWFKEEVRSKIEDDKVLRRTFIFLDLGCAMLRGAVEEDVFTKGLDALDKYDLKEFLARYGADKITYESALVRGTYDFPFADRNPKNRSGSLAAGAIIRGMWRTMFQYRGSMFYRMMAGMGDVVFAPLYLVLKRRGVKFKLFHAVKEIKTHGGKATHRHVDEIVLNQQVRVKENREYQPLYDVDGLPCWPSEPLFEQLVEGKELEEGLRHGKNFNLESHWTEWAKGKKVTLTRGEDFDHVVLGISLGALKDLCPTLIEEDSRWGTMLERVPTVQTFGVQVWLNPTSDRFGWTVPVIIDALAEPLGTWADMSHLLPRETWLDPGPGSIAYFCGVLPDAPKVPPPSDARFPETQEKRVRDMARAWFSGYTHALWGPEATTGDDPSGLNRWLLYTPLPNEPPDARFDWQFFRANIDPSERYVNTPAGSIQFRLRSDDSGFQNLVLAGDWTQNNLNLGCVEAAVVSGLQAARALCRRAGRPDVVPILSETDTLTTAPRARRSRRRR
jgi:uncharacterized protein with NAD-binding domain and iron-sulfur cluster